MSLPLFTEIHDLEGREPVGAVLTAGVKSASLPKGDEKAGKGEAPVYTDRFWFVSPFEDERRIRPLLPEFRRFNTAVQPARVVVHGNFVHATIADAFAFHLRAQRLPRPNPNPKSLAPACTGDGRSASRFHSIEADGREVWREIVCPHGQCEFRQGAPAACKPFGRLYFRPSWDHYRDREFHGPTPLTKWTTGSWNSVSNLVGFFDHVSTQAERLGIIPQRPPGAAFNPQCPIYGLPFTLTLGRKTQPQHGRSFPVVAISPETDLIGFFFMQKQQLEELGGRLQLVAGNATAEESSQEAIAADVRAITPSIPGSVIDVAE